MHVVRKMGKAPRTLSSSAATKAPAESDGESLSTKKCVPKVDPSAWRLPIISRQKLQGLKFYVGLGILALGVSATVAVVIVRRRRRQKLEKRANRYDFAGPKSESESMTTAEMQHAFDYYSRLQEARVRERDPRDVPGLDTTVLPEDSPCEHCSSEDTSYDDDSPQRAYQEMVKLPDIPHSDICCRCSSVERSGLLCASRNG